MVAKLRRLLAIVFLSVGISSSLAAQSDEIPGKKNSPYRISAAGKQITIRANKSIRHVMLWTTDGNRVAEHKDINATTFTLDANINRKTFFLMIGLNDGKVYTEKIGLP